jgi:glycosyltransferase involved in cell wall biosynthesis
MNSNNRRLIIDALAYESGKAFGFQEFMFNLLEFFYQNRRSLNFEEVIIVCIDKQKKDFDKFNDKFQLVGFRIPNLFVRLLYQQVMPLILKVSQSDVILNLYNYSAYFSFSKNVLVVHDLLYLRKKLLPVWYIRLHRKLFIARSISNADHIIAISEFTKRDITNNTKVSQSKPISVVYNYFNFIKYDYSDNLDIKNLNKNYFLCVSSSAFHKNIVTVLMSFEKFCNSNDEMNLYLVGKISDNVALNYYNQLQIKVKNRIKVFADISNQSMGILYANCHTYISASLFEGLGMPVVEAMYFKARLLLSDIEVFREITKNKASFFDPNSVDQLSLKMIQSSESNYEKTSFDLLDFSAINTSEKYIKILNSI